MSTNQLEDKQDQGSQILVHKEVPARKEMIHYGLGFFGIILVWTMVGSFLTFYYTDIVGISAGVVGTLMLIVRVFDGVTDLGMGTVVDRTKSKHGKARPWVLWMAIPFGVTSVLLFAVPDVSMTYKIVYAYISYIALIICYTAISIPYKTLLGLMTQDQQGRSLLNIYTGVFTMLATLSVMILTEPIASAIGGSIGWTVVAGILGLTTVITSNIAFRSTKERIQKKPSLEKKEKTAFKIEFKALITNKYWIIISLYCVISYIFQALLSSAGLYYATYVFSNTSLFSIFALALFVPTIVSFFFIARLVNKFGKRNVALVAVIIGVVGGLVKLIDPTNVTIYIIGSIIQGFGLIPTITVLYAMINDTAEFTEWKLGIRIEGLINSGASFGMKLGAGIGGAIIGWLLAFGGYAAGIPEQTASATQMIYALNIHIPLLLGIGQVILLWMYRLDHHYTTIVQDIHDRKK